MTLSVSVPVCVCLCVRVRVRVYVPLCEVHRGSNSGMDSVEH